MPYISLSSMGLDIADVNNDGWPDIYVADMLPDDEHRLKTTTSFETWDRLQPTAQRFLLSVHPQHAHLNNGNGTFSDNRQMAGVARTDWSWSALIADLDLDGYKDIYVTKRPRERHHVPELHRVPWRTGRPWSRPRAGAAWTSGGWSTR